MIMMNMTVFRGLFVAGVALFTLIAGQQQVWSQGQDNPLEFRTEFQRIGGEIGLSSVWMSGKYLINCPEFTEGAKINPVIALAYDYPIISGALRFEALAGYQGRSITSTFNSRENVSVRSQNGIYPDVDVDFENVGEARFSYIFLLPSMKYYFTKGIYAGAGLNVGLLLGATTQYTKNILSKTVDINEVGISEVFYPEQESSDPYSKVFPEEDRSDASTLGLDGAFYVGAELPLGRRIKIGPRLLYTLPFTPVFTNPDLKLSTLQFLIGLRFDLDE